MHISLSQVVLLMTEDGLTVGFHPIASVGPFAVQANRDHRPRTARGSPSSPACRVEARPDRFATDSTSTPVVWTCVGLAIKRPGRQRLLGVETQAMRVPVARKRIARQFPASSNPGETCTTYKEHRRQATPLASRAG